MHQVVVLAVAGNILQIFDINFDITVHKIVGKCLSGICISKLIFDALFTLIIQR
jgi:hypothetical protein